MLIIYILNNFVVFFLLINNTNSIKYDRRDGINFKDETTELPITTTTTGQRPTHPMDNPDWLPPQGPNPEQSKYYWLNIGKNILEKQLKKNQLNTNVAKNVIIFIGDGLSIATQTATRVYMGGEKIELSFEKFPYTGLAKVIFKLMLSSFHMLYSLYKYM